jgi:Cys-tRNA(Pro) deacylase
VNESNLSEVWGPRQLSQYVTASGTAATLLPMTVETPTVAAAAAALGCDPAQIVKTLVLLVKGSPWVVIACGVMPVDMGRVARHCGVGKKQVKLADPDTVLAVTGYPVGGVPPIGHRQRCRVLVDPSLQSWPEVYAGGGDDRTLLRIAPAELARVLAPEWLEP